LAVHSDTHCHLNLNSFQEILPEVLDRARQAGVTRILVPGIDLPTSRRAVELSRLEPELCAAVGVHPNDALTWDSSSLSDLRQLAVQPRVAAIGEIGLDYYRDQAPPALQVEILRVQLDLARELEKPVVLHSRASLPELWAYVRAWWLELKSSASPLAKRPGVFHSYEGSLETALEIAACGFFIGVSGPVTFLNARERQHLVASLPVESLLMETDSPFLAPHPKRGRPNEPANVVLIAEKTASLHAMTLDRLLALTNLNSDEIFGWRTPA
jgi:TatD DNase family protein